MLSNLTQFQQATGATAINFNLSFIGNNKVRAVVQVLTTDKATDTALADSLKMPIAVEGSLADFDTMLLNELMSVDLTPATKAANPAPAATPATAETANETNAETDADVNFDFNDEDAL